MSNLTPTQLGYLANAFRCFESEPKVNLEQFALLSNLKNAASARVMLRNTKKKLLENDSATLTSTQLMYIANAWRCFETEPKVDLYRFATLSKLKNAASARVMLRNTKQKLFELASGPDDKGSADAGTASAISTPKKVKSAAKNATATPASGKKRGRPASVKKSSAGIVKEESGGEEEEAEEEVGRSGKKVKLGSAASFKEENTSIIREGSAGIIKEEKESEGEEEALHGFGKRMNTTGASTVDAGAGTFTASPAHRNAD